MRVPDRPKVLPAVEAEVLIIGGTPRADIAGGDGATGLEGAGGRDGAVLAAAIDL